MKTYLFPGQGSQGRGMGAGLFDQFRDLTDKADQVLGYSVRELCLHDPQRTLNKTQFTQPALYVVNALAYYRAMEVLDARPQFVAGHSLGEFNALLAAECFDFETGLRLVQKRGELMSRAAGGGMAAILNASSEQIRTALIEAGLDQVDLANYNSPSQIVISGPIVQIGKAQALFDRDEMRYYPLNTSGAFHSRMMEPARREFEQFLAQFSFAAPTIPVLSNVTADVYLPDQIHRNLAQQLSSTVRWYEGMQALLDRAEQAGAVMTFQELGHGDVLTKITRRILAETGGQGIVVDKDPARAWEPQAARSAAAAEISESSQTSTPIVAGAGGRRVAEAPPPAAEVRSVEHKVNEWNQKFPVGSQLRAAEFDDEVLITRTKAVVLFGHRAAVYMENYKGYFDIDGLAPA